MDFLIQNVVVGSNELIIHICNIFSVILEMENALIYWMYHIKYIVITAEKV